MLQFIAGVSSSGDASEFYKLFYLLARTKVSKGVL